MINKISIIICVLILSIPVSTAWKYIDTINTTGINITGNGSKDDLILLTANGLTNYPKVTWVAYNPVNNTYEEVAWVVAHYLHPVLGVHQHWAIETLNEDGSFSSKFSIGYSNRSTLMDIIVDSARFKGTNIDMYDDETITGITDESIYFTTLKQKLGTSNESIFMIDPYSNGNTPIEIRMFRESNTSAPRHLTLYKGDNTPTIKFQFDVENGDFYHQGITDFGAQSTARTAVAANNFYVNTSKPIPNLCQSTASGTGNWVYAHNGTAGC